MVDVSSVMAMFVAFVAFVALAALPSIDTPFRVWLALVRFSKIPVVPMYTVELARMAGYQVATDVVLSVVATLVAFVAVVAVPALPSIDTPFKVWLALVRFSAIAVVPMYTVELPRTADGIVPDS